MGLSKLELDAYHETGHAVMMAACGFTVERVYIQGREGEGKALAAELAEPKDAAGWEHLLWCGILCAAAGGAAEMLLSFRRPPQEAYRPPWLGTDQDKITDFLRRLGLLSGASDDLVKQVACVYLAERFTYIEKMALLLSERRSLQGPELSGLLHRVSPLSDDEWRFLKQRLQENSG